MTDKTYALAVVMIAAAVTAGLRFLPFWIFGKGRKTPALVTHLGKTLPCAIMGMLVVYCLKDVSLTQPPHGIPELLGCLTVAGLHVWKRNTLLSIGLGTLCYMLMLHFLF